MTIFKINVENHIARAFRGALDRAGQHVDRQVGGVPLRPHVEELWAKLQSPIQLEDEGWLVLRPSDLRFGGVSGSGTTLTTSLGFSGRPMVVLGDAPTVPAIALPDNDGEAPGNGIHLLAWAEIPHAEAQEELKRALVGKRLHLGNKHLDIEDVDVYGTGGDTAVVRVDFDGDAKGTIYFVGRPVYDPIHRRLSVPDLDYDLETKNVIAKVAEWLLHDRVRGFLRANAIWSAGEHLEEAKQRIDILLDRDLGDNVRLDGEVDSIEPVGVRVDMDAIRILVRADGQARLTIH